MRRLMTRKLFCSCLFIFGTVPPAGSARADVAAPVPPPLAEAVTNLTTWAASVHAHVGVDIVAVDTGAVMAAVNEHAPLNPASNTKVLTAAVVLDRMGPDFRFTTGLFGSVVNHAVSDLVIRGNGDPSLGVAQLYELAGALRGLGVERVEKLLVDQSAFDDSVVPPAFEQQPNEWAPFRAPISAVSLERNSVTLTVSPGAVGTKASVWFDPPGFVDLHGSIETRPSSAADGVKWTLSPSGARLRADVSGFVGAAIPRARYEKRIDDPRLFAGYAFREILKRVGIAVSGDVTAGGANAHERLAYVESQPLGVLVRELGKNSDNFYAETLLKTLGAATHAAPAHTVDGTAAVTDWLKDNGALDAGTHLVNGSGLFDSNRVTASELVTALRVAYRSSRIGPDFVSQLAVGGVDGTLRSRFGRLAVNRVVRAKSGTLDDVIALSGYALSPSGAAPVAFSLILNQVTGHHAEARDHIDRVVEALAATTR
jgi:D-alanyl-D-alanine carboxypeptidase/D-alanyl-D-alanine-endopeptidase (penicillin-binding protein 4)